MTYNLKPFLITLLLFFTATAFGQQRPTDTVLYQTPVNNAIAYFKRAMGIQSGFYNGQEYVFYNRQKKDNVFFQDQDNWDKSTINYDGALYTDIPVMYDLFKGILVVQLYDKAATYYLVNEKIKNFTLSGHRFIYKTADSLEANGLVTGIYDELYNTKSEVLVKRSKYLQITPTQQKEYLENDKLYVKKDIYHEVSGKSSLLSALKDKRKELRKYIKDNSISFKNNLEGATLIIVAYYDKITQ